MFSQPPPSPPPSQLESLIRLSEGLAKTRLSPTVTRSDVREAVRLMNVATLGAATDPVTGRVDMNMLATGLSARERQQTEALLAHVRAYAATVRGRRMAMADLVKGVKEFGGVEVDLGEVREVVRVMEGEGEVKFSERGQTVFIKAGQ